MVPGLYFNIVISHSVKGGRRVRRPYGIVTHDKKGHISFSINSFPIPIPPDRIRKNVITQGVQLLLITDNPFVVVPLPYRHAGRMPRFVDPFRAGGFE